MALQLHPALRALGVGLGGLALLIGGSLAAYSGLKSLIQAAVSAPPAPVAAPAAQNYIANPAVGGKRIPLIVKQSHGDWNRVSVADQKMLESMTAGHGRAMFQDLVKKQSARSRGPMKSQKAKD